MQTQGQFSFEREDAARAAFAEVGPAAQVTVREVARSMDFDRDEYRERVTEDVVQSARDAIFASLLRVTVGTREEWDEWREAHPDVDVHEAGSEHVDRVVWHVAPFAERAVAATFQDERDAAVNTLRRQAFGRVYRPLFYDE